MPTKSRIHVAIVDDHQMFTDGLTLYLKTFPFIEIVNKSRSGEEILAVRFSIIPDVVFMDINMPGMNGIEVTKRLLAKYSKIKVVAISMSDDKYIIKEMFKAGAVGYLTKGQTFEEIKKVLERIKQGKKYLSPDIADDMVNGSIEEIKDEYSLREIDILRLMSDNKTNKEIANILGVSERTIEEEKRHIGKKMGVTKSAAMVAMAFRLGLLP